MFCTLFQTFMLLRIHGIVLLRSKLNDLASFRLAVNEFKFSPFQACQNDIL